MVGGPESSVISGWTEIARYLGTAVSTAHRWNKDHGMPVMWTPGGRALTTKSLIDQWVLARSQVRYEALKAARAKRDREAEGQGPAGENQSLTPDS